MRKFYSFVAVLLATLLAVSCGVVKPAPAPKVINLALVGSVQSNQFFNLDYGIRLSVKDARTNTRVLQKYDASATYLPQVSVSPDIFSFVSESSRRYMRTLGFNLDADVATDYMMTLSINE